MGVWEKGEGRVEKGEGREEVGDLCREGREGREKVDIGFGEGMRCLYLVPHLVRACMQWY